MTWEMRAKPLPEFAFTRTKNGSLGRILKRFSQIQGGDPKGDGTGGESVYGEPFEDEFFDARLSHEVLETFASTPLTWPWEPVLKGSPPRKAGRVHL